MQIIVCSLAFHTLLVLVLIYKPCFVRHGNELYYYMI